MPELYVCADANFFKTKNEEDNMPLINKWNTTIKPEDYVLIVGNFSYGDTNETKNLIEQLNGKKKIMDYSTAISKNIPIEDWESFGVKVSDYVHGWIKGDIEGKKTDVILATNKKCLRTCENVYFAAAGSLMESKERFKNNCLNLSIELWDYAPVQYNSIPYLIDNCLLYEKMEGD